MRSLGPLVKTRAFGMTLHQAAGFSRLREIGEDEVKKIRLSAELRRNGKKRGEWAELVFAARAMERRFRLWRPWGESSGYDWVIEQESGEFARVQVKSTLFPEGEGYSCSLKDSKGVYKKNTFDFVAAYVIPVDVWYILPEKLVRGMWSVGLHPELEKSKYGEYEENWELMRGSQTGIEMQASANIVLAPKKGSFKGQRARLLGHL